MLCYQNLGNGDARHDAEFLCDAQHFAFALDGWPRGRVCSAVASASSEREEMRLRSQK